MSEATASAETEELEPRAASGQTATPLHPMYLAMGTLAIIGAVVAGLVCFGPGRATVDGQPVWVPRGATVENVAALGWMAGTPGDLVSVSGRLLQRGGGGAPVVRIDGSDATSTTVIVRGACVTSGHGRDRAEETATRTVETTPSMEYVGTGPVESVEDSGTPGTVEVVVGAVSGEEASRRVLSDGSPTIVRRERAWHGSKEVALTFDDGPWPKSTEAVLAQLAAAQAKATFFMLGTQVKGRPELAREVLDAGMEIGDHSYSHKLLARAKHRTITREISWGASAIENAVGVRPVWYRPAGGSKNAFVLREAKRLKLRVVFWTIDPHDYRRPGARVIARRVLDNVRPGSVVLMHDGWGDRAQTVAALGLILKGLRARGYDMVTLSRLHRLPGATP